MPRGRQSSKHPIVSNKEIVDTVSLLVAAGVTTDVDIATTVNDYTGTVGTMPQAAKILGFYLEISYNLSQVIVGRLDWYLCKRESNRLASSFPPAGGTGGSALRKSIFHERKGVLDGGSGTNIGGQTAKSVEFIKIPKGFQRMGELDVWMLRFQASTQYSVCVKCIYKWYI